MKSNEERNIIINEERRKENKLKKRS
jgi:hypothetical protein